MNPAVLISKKKNTKNLAEYIIRSGEVSRHELAEAFNLSIATITNIINDLISKNIVYEGSIYQSNVGRKAKLIKFNSKLGYIIAANINVLNKLDLYVCDLSGEVMDSRQVDIQYTVTPENQEIKIIESITNAISNYLKELPNAIKELILGTAVSVPGIVNNKSTIYAPYFKWKNLHLGIPLQAALCMPVHLENVARIKSVYELRYIGESEKNIIYLSLSPGVGIVYFQNRKMILGKNSINGEAGHMSLDINGPECYCGNRGCFELYCGELAIIKKGFSLLEGPNRCDILYKLVKQQNYPLNIETLFTARNLGSIKVHGILTEVARYLSSAIVSLFNIFDPDRIIISGSLVNNDDYVFNTAVMEAKSLILCRFSRDMNISTTHLKTGEIEKGICAYMLDKLIDNLI